MFDWLQSLTNAFVSVVIGALALVGLASPTPEVSVVHTQVISSTTEQVASSTEIKTPKPVESNASNSIIDSLKKQVENLTKKVVEQVTKPAETAVVTLPVNQPSTSVATSSQPTITTDTQPSTQTTGAVITSVTITATLTSATIEWSTDKPSDSKVFVAGGGISTSVHQSESGISTHHLVHVTGLSGSTDYAYDIEAIANQQVTRKQGTFSSQADLLDISLQVNKNTVPLSGWDMVEVTAQFTKNGKYVPVDISFSAPSDSRTYKILKNWPECGNLPFVVQLVGTSGGTCYSEPKVSFLYLPTSLGTHTITANAGGIIKSIDISVTPYVRVNTVVTSTDANATISSNSSAVHEFGKLIFSKGDEKISLGSIFIESNPAPITVKAQIGGGWGGTHSATTAEGKASAIYVGNFGIITPTEVPLYVWGPAVPGNYTLTVTKIEAMGMNSGLPAIDNWIPQIFHFTVQ